MNDVELPEMRKSVLSAVHALSDEGYQRRVWIRKEYPDEGYYDDFETNLHILFDDTPVLDDPESSVGMILRSRDEAGALKGLAVAIDSLLAREGGDREDVDYINSPLWGAVVSAASIALAAMNR
ncbi:MULTISPECIES: SCO4402 family protein [unclassified Streptomyces]|uniref:SCO4402 family protein n=2 Tax=Streptomyces TaxID=1883 RepID=UPI002FEF88F6